MATSYMRFDSIQSVEEYLDNIPKFQSTGASAANFDLDRFKQFCDELGNPHRKFPVVHVGGTNGKGSTCRILGTIYEKSGYKTGIYTSPHILHFNERFTINGDRISDDKLIRFFQQNVNLLEKYELTYFEISTAIAFWWFAESDIDLGIIEVGLGGRLDATNIIEPLASVITSISLDHTDILGDSLQQIAREKAGIIKPDRPAVLGDLPDEALNEIRNIAAQNGSELYTIDELNPTFLQSGRYRLTVDGTALMIRTNLSTPVQAKNIAMAWQVSRLIGNQFPISAEQFIEALEDVDLGFGRFSSFSDKKRWYFDGGHNIEAIKMLKQSVRNVGSIDNAILILSLMRDKINPEMISEFSEFKNIYYYQLDFSRAASFEEVTKWLPNANPFPVDSEKQKLLLEDFNSELVIFAGSFYFYSTVREWIRSFALNS